MLTKTGLIDLIHDINPTAEGHVAQEGDVALVDIDGYRAGAGARPGGAPA